MTNRNGAALILLAFLAGADGASGQTSKSRGMTDVETSIWRQFEAMRTGTDVPYRAEDWPHWDLTAMQCSATDINIGRQLALELAEACGAETMDVANEFLQIFLPGIDVMLPPDEVEIQPHTFWGTTRDTAEAVAAAGSYPLMLVKCVTTAARVTDLRIARAAASQIQSEKDRIDSIGDLVSLVLDIGAAFKNLAQFAEWAVNVGGSLSKVPEQMKRWLRAARSGHESKLHGFKVDLDAARASLGDCSVTWAEKTVENTLKDAREYIAMRRRDVVHFEKRIYCEAMGRREPDSEPVPTGRITVMPSFDALDATHTMIEDTGKALVEMERQREELRKLAEAKRKEQQAYLADVGAAMRAVGPTLSQCDVAALTKLQAELERLLDHDCASDTNRTDPLFTQLDKVGKAIDLALQVQLWLGPLGLEIDTLITECRYNGASLKYAGALKELRSLAKTYTAVDIRKCDGASWLAGDALKRITAGRTALSDVIGASRTLIQEASDARNRCEFETARDLLEQANTRGRTDCPIPFQECSAGSNEFVCILVKIEETRLQRKADLDAAESNYRAEIAELGRQASELETWGQEQVKIALGDSPQRCDARRQVSLIAADLRGLQTKGCPGKKDTGFASAANALEAQLIGADAGLATRVSAAQTRGQAAAASCDPAVVEAAITELDQLRRLLCGAAGADSSALKAELKRIDQETRDAKGIAAEAGARIGRWFQACDAAAIQTTEALILNESSCGYRQFSFAEKELLQTYAEIADAVTAGDLVGRKDRALAAIGGNLKRAEIQIAAAEKRSKQGAVTAEERRTVQSEIDRAGAELDGAWSIFDRLHNETLIPEVCYQAREGEWKRLRARLDGIALYTGVGDTDGEEPDKAIWDVKDEATHYTSSSDTDDESEPEDTTSPDVDALLRAAWEAYSKCDFDGADALTQEALKKDPTELRTGRLRVLILRQRAAANLYQDARRARTLASAQRAMAAARIKLPPPRCLVTGIQDLLRDLEGELAELEEEERRRAEQEWEDMYDEFARAAIGLLGEVVRRDDPVRRPPRGGGGGTTSGPSGPGGGTCFVQAPSGDTGGIPYVLVRVVGNVTVYVPRTIVARGGIDVPTLVNKMKEVDPSLKRAEGPFRSYGAALAWAKEQCR